MYVTTFNDPLTIEDYNDLQYIWSMAKDYAKETLELGDWEAILYADGIMQEELEEKEYMRKIGE
jgi:hypothetical protein